MVPISVFPTGLTRVTSQSTIPFAVEVAELLASGVFQLFEAEHHAKRFLFLVPRSAPTVVFILVDEPGDFHVMLPSGKPSQNSLRLATTADIDDENILEGWMHQVHSGAGRYVFLLFVGDWELRRISKRPCVKNIFDMQRFLPTSIDYTEFESEYRPNGV